MELSTSNTSTDHWITTEGITNYTSLDISHLYFPNGSSETFSNENNTPAWLLYALFGINSFFLIFGLFGNSSGIIVMLHSSSKLQTYGMLVINLAITDIIALTSNFFNLLSLRVILDSDVRALTDSGCTLYMVVQVATKNYSAYVTVLICIDRFIAVQYPLQHKLILSRKLRIVSLFTCGCISLLVSLFAAMQYSEITNGVCHFNAHTISAHLGLRLLLLIVFTVLPMIVLLSLTPIIIFNLIKQHAKMTKFTNNEEKAQLIRASVMLSCVVVTYIILVGLPSVAFTVLRWRGVVGNSSNEIIILCIATAYQLNHAINICFYVSNIDFREQFLHLFGCPCKLQQQTMELNHDKAVGNRTNI